MGKRALYALGIFFVFSASGLFSTAHAASASYRYLKWDITQKKGADACGDGPCVQASEFGLLLGFDPVAWPPETAVTNPDGNNPDSEIPPNLIDSDTGTKWLDHNFSTDSDSVNGNSVVIFDAGAPVTFDGYYYKTGGDSPERDPVSWLLYGSNDSEAWTLLDSEASVEVTDDRESTTIGFGLGEVPDEVELAGSGTNEDPYQVTSCDDLQQIGNGLHASYILENSLDCREEGSDVMIADPVHPFAGDFNGNGKTVEFSIDESDQDFVGLFRATNNATIHDLVVGADTAISGHDLVGSMAGLMTNSTLLRVVSFASVTGSNMSSIFGSPDVGIGGLVGEVDNGQVLGSGFAGRVIGIGIVGGIAGAMHNNSSISRSAAVADIAGLFGVGGIVGSMQEGAVRNSYSSSTLVLPHDLAAENEEAFGGQSMGLLGGLVGLSLEGTISRSYSAGTVYAENSEDVSAPFAGILAGALGGTVAYSFTTVSSPSDVLFGDAFSYVNETEYVSDWFDATGRESTDCIPNDAPGCRGIEAPPGYWMDRSHEPVDHFNPAVVWDFTGAGPYPALRMYADEEPEESDDADSGDSDIAPTEQILSENRFLLEGTPQGWHDDDNHWEYDLPFSFPFFGEDYDTVYVSSNGYLGFADSSDLNRTTFHVEDGTPGVPIISALAHDLRTDAGGGDIYVTVTADTVRFRWQAVEFDNEDNHLNFEIVLHQNGTFEINYGPMDAALSDEARVGINNGAGDYVRSAYDNEDDLRDHMASFWTPADFSDEDKGGDTDEDTDTHDETPAPKKHRSGSSSLSISQLASLGVVLANAPKTPAAAPQGPTATPETPAVRDLAVGAAGEDVRLLQKFLNANGYPLAASGPGAPGSETTLFGPLTRAALAKFQAANNISPAIGYFGPVTRAKIKELGLAGAWW